MSQTNPSWASLLHQRPSPSASEPPDASNSSATNPPEDNSAAAAAQFPAWRTTPPRRVAMISGHMDLSPEEFARGYHALLDAALERGDSFILADAQGADELALAYLLARDASAAGRITVYAARQANVARLQQLGVKAVLSEMHASAAAVDEVTGVGRTEGGGRGRQSHLRRDAMMTKKSDYDILWVRSEAESRALYGDKYRPRVSATELNRQRRAGMLAKQGGNT
ncbi:hypothetical protein PG994_007032 [Apiospora phragmitis]|uniref:STAS domain-containing protein n=1 Tax=Apiospora phragmitis TaxID=2905665 RepID=A0ABR1UZM4_9PEZI